MIYTINNNNNKSYLIKFMIHISGLSQYSQTFSCVGSHEQNMLHVWTSVVCVNGLRLTLCVAVNIEYKNV
jgi:hypothetical protein